MKRPLIAAATAAMVASSVVQAGEQVDRGFHRVGKTIWTEFDDRTEIARFPLESTDPSFIVYVEYFPPEDDPCSEEDAWWGDCIPHNLCEIWVAVRADLQPVRTEPIQPDPGKVLIAWFDEGMRQGSGTHMDWHWDFDVFVEAWNGEALRFVDGHVLRYADEQCMAAVRLEYHKNFKAMFNRWPR